MADSEYTLAKIGDNSPPPDVDPFLEQLEEEYAKLIEEIGDHELKLYRLPKEVKSDDDVAAINGWVVAAKKLFRCLEDGRKDKKDFYIKRGKLIETWFGALKTGIETKADAISQRSTGYLTAKREREEAEAAARAVQARRQAEEQAAVERAEREAVEQAALAAREAEERLRAAKDDAARAEAEEARRVALEQQRLAQDAADQAAKDAHKLDKVADRTERVLAGDHTLEKTQGGGANASVKTVWVGKVQNMGALLTSLGPLGSFLKESEVYDAVARAAKADARPAIPGVVWDTKLETKIHATRTQS